MVPADRRRAVSRTLRACAVSAIAIAAPSVPAAAQSWGASEQTAGLRDGEGFTGLSFQCLAAGKVRMTFSGFAQRLQPNHPYTVALSVDGTAMLYDAGTGADGTRIHVDGTLPAFAPMIELLRKGKAAEVSGPAGRYAVPLKGSGAALATFGERCG